MVKTTTFSWIIFLLCLLQLISLSLSSCESHCSLCYINNPYKIESYFTFVNNGFCAVCEKPYVSLDGDCILLDNLPYSIIQEECTVYDYNLQCIKCKDINIDNESTVYSNSFLRECHNHVIKDDKDNKTNIGKIFYLYVAPIIGSILVIWGAITLVICSLKRKKDNMNKEEKKEKPKNITQTGESQILNFDFQCNYIIIGGNKELKCDNQALYQLNCSYCHCFCKTHCNDFNDEIKKSKLDEVTIECPICKERVIGVNLINRCEQCKEIKKVKTLYCEGKCKFCSKCFDAFYAKSTTCPNGHKLLR